MRDARKAKAEALFQAALDLPEDERPSYLGRECGDDVALLRNVESLLQHFDEASDSFLSTPIRSDYTDIDPDDVMPEQIGHYRLVRRRRRNTNRRYRLLSGGLHILRQHSGLRCG